ncbi:hypothetical protein SUGI_0638970 [Cryptomeria japonica]|nr:hypothetical protein SUGI_0638970 [Cryptomeria japonica]
MVRFVSLHSAVFGLFAFHPCFLASVEGSDFATPMEHVVALLFVAPIFPEVVCSGNAVSDPIEVDSWGIVRALTFRFFGGGGHWGCSVAQFIDGNLYSLYESRQERREKFRRLGQITFAIKVLQGVAKRELESRARLSKMSSIISGYHMASVSPGRVEYGCRANRAGGIRRPISLIPKEAMEKKNDHRFETQEPTSPKVSCTGQVKKIKQAKQILMRSQDRPPPSSQTRPLLSPPGGKFSKMKSFFSGKKVTESALCESPDQIEVNNCPSLGQMKRFSSARHCDALANVWTEIHSN